MCSDAILRRSLDIGWSNRRFIKCHSFSLCMYISIQLLNSKGRCTAAAGQDRIYWHKWLPEKWKSRYKFVVNQVMQLFGSQKVRLSEVWQGCKNVDIMNLDETECFWQELLSCWFSQKEKRLWQETDRLCPSLLQSLCKCPSSKSFHIIRVILGCIANSYFLIVLVQ